MAKLNNPFTSREVKPELVEVLKKSIYEFEKTHKGNGLKSPFKLSQYWLGAKNWASMQSLIKAINSLNAERKEEKKNLLYVQPSTSDKPEIVLVRLTDDLTLFDMKEPKEAEQKQPSKEALLKNLQSAIEKVGSASASGGWQDEYQALLKKYCK